MADLQQFEESDKHFAKAMTLDPENSTILVHRGLLQFQWKGDVSKGIDFIKKALEIDEKSAFGYETLATIEVQRWAIIQINLFKFFEDSFKWEKWRNQKDFYFEIFTFS